MTDPALGALDLLLDATRESAPIDDGFVGHVMSEVRTMEERRWSRRVMRRPVVFGIAAAVLVTGGTVAAVVGTNNPSAPHDVKVPAKTRTIAKTDAPAAPIDVVASPRRSAARPSAPAPRVIEDSEGFLTDHTAFILDAKTGLRLQTESYTNDFVVGKDHRVTLTLENTGTKPITFSAAKDCALQVMAFPKGTNSAPVYQSPEDYSGFEWECAGSDVDPRTQPFSETFVLEPGERKVADAYVNLDREGEWKLGGMCKCSYSRMESVTSPQPKSNPFAELFRDALPSQLLPERYEGHDLVTPGIIVRARS